LNDATRWGSIARNVVALTSAPRVQRRQISTLSPEQTRLLLDAAIEDDLSAVYVLAISTGMRQGELLALKWQDINLDGASVHIRSTLHRTKSGFVFNEPKTSRSRRQVVLTQTAVAALRRHRVAQAERRLEMGAYWQDQDLVFTNEIGGPVDAGNLRNRSFSPLLQRAALPKIRFHDLRHTAATLMLSRGIHPKVVSEMLGHSQIAITLDLYSHVTPTMQRDAAQLMDQVLQAAN
jgi:integrase